MIKVNIMWGDLSKRFQKKILQVFGDNCNWDVIPIAEMEIEDERDITIDSFYGDAGFEPDIDDTHIFVGTVNTCLSNVEEILNRMDVAKKVPTAAQIRTLCHDIKWACNYAKNNLLNDRW